MGPDLINYRLPMEAPSVESEPKPALVAEKSAVTEHLLPNIVGGSLSALVTLSYSLSYGALVFSGPELQPHVPAGLQAALMAAWIVALIVAFGSSFHFAI